MLLTAGAAQAQDSTLAPDVAAVHAAAVVERQCDEIGGRSVLEAAEALTGIGAVWGQVAASFAEHRTPYLLYWRGVLGQCLAQDGRALSDLLDFIRLSEDDPGQSSLVQDARRRVRLIRRGVPLAWQAAAEGDSGRPQRAAGLALVIGGGSVALFGGLMHGISFAEAELSRADIGWTSTAAVDEPGWTRLQGLNRAGFGLLAGGVTTAAVGLVVTLTALERPTEGPVALPWLAPRPDGAVVGVAARF